MKSEKNFGLTFTKADFVNLNVNWRKQKLLKRFGNDLNSEKLINLL